ncbi:mandelate racemase/muconate lactonizing enzyme family protein [Marinomonas sp. MED121]|uniref:mandelate racemase n=1 Tax=Marinomonas sp. MED121 TaxID=314277 RepID=UPI00006902A2|nr:mandelate racemase [Marinomonas sp. MED121]EAQ63235.1 mandelate racemase/muconate lactonizing enzyme family protein [Marinomonas sp. MED121]
MQHRIEKVEVFCLQDPQADFVRFEGSYQNVVVVVTADNGLYGIGESDSPPSIIKALIEAPTYNHLSQGLATLLLGEALDDPKRLWQKMYQNTYWHGRNGALIHAISALDIGICMHVSTRPPCIPILASKNTISCPLMPRFTP